MKKLRFNFIDVIWLGICLTVGIWAGSLAHAGINVPFTGSNPPDVDSTTVFQYVGNMFNRAPTTLDVNEQLNRSGTLQPTPVTIAPTFEITFDQVPPGDTLTFTAETGQVLTQHSAPTQRHDGTWPNGLSSASGQGHEWVFDGADDYITSTIAPPAGSFSTACLVTPHTLTGDVIFFANYGAANFYGWAAEIYQDDVYFTISDDGTGGAHITSISKNASVALGRQSFIATTFDGTTKAMAVYVDELSAATGIATGTVFAGASNLSIGAEATGSIVEPVEIAHCVIFDGTVLTAAQVQSLRRYWLGLSNRQDNQITVVSAAPPSVMVAAPGSGTEPFFRDFGANLSAIGSPASGSGGIYGSKDITNLAQYGSFEVGSPHPTGWSITETVGDGTAAVDVDTTTMVHGASSIKSITTGTTAFTQSRSTIFPIDNTKAYTFTIWLKGAAGNENMQVLIDEYSAVPAYITYQNIAPAGTDVPTGWTRYAATISSWNASTANGIITITQNSPGSVVYFDAVMAIQSSTVTDAGCWTSAAASAVCNYTQASMTNPLDSGNWEIDFTARSPNAWSGATYRRLLYVVGNGANHDRVDVGFTSSNAYFEVYDSGGTIHSSSVACAKAADTDVAIKAVHTSMGEIYICCDGVCGTTVTGATMTTSPTLQIGNVTDGFDVWIKDLNFYSWPDGAGDLYDMSGENLVIESSPNAQSTQALTILPNQLIDPVLNTKTASIIHENDASAQHYFFYTLPSAIAGHKYTTTAYLKYLNHRYVAFCAEDLANRVDVDLQSCTAAIQSGFTSYTTTKNGDWCKISAQWTSTGYTGYTPIFYLASAIGGAVSLQGLDQDSYGVCGVQLVDNTDGVIVGSGPYKKTTGVAKPRLDLTQHGNPTTGFSDLQMSDGNRVSSRVFDSALNQYYTHIHNSNIDIWASSSTTTVAFRMTPTVTYGHLFKKAAGDYYGIRAYVTDTGEVYIGFGKNPSLVYLYYAPGSIIANQTYILQIVRDGNTATAYLNGLSSGSSDVTSAGVASDSVFYVAAGILAAAPLKGDIYFLQGDPRALSATELAAQREKLWGIYSNKSKDTQSFNFSRSTVASKTLDSGPTSLSQVAINVPRVSDGVTIEGQVTQLHGLTEAFDSWTSTDCTKTPNVETAPDGTMTADLLDNTADVGGRTYNTTASLGALAGRTFTQSVWVKAYSTRHKVTIRTTEIGIGAICTSTPMAETYWTRVSVQCTAAGGGSGDFRYYVLPGDDGVASGQAYFWGHNFTETKFLTSYIQNTGAETSQVTRTADNLSIPLHQASTNKDLLPTLFGPLPNMANTLTVEFEAKNPFGSGISSTDKPFIELSGNTGTATSNRNRLYMMILDSGKIALGFYDNASNATYIQSAVDPIVYNNWHTYKVFVDFSDLSRTRLYRDGVSITDTTGGLSGTATFDTTNTSLRVGNIYDGTVNGFCTIENLRINEVAF